MARPRKEPQTEKAAEPELVQRVSKSVDSRNAWISALAAIRTVVDQLLKSAIEESSELEPSKFDSGLAALNRATQLLAGAHGLEPAPTTNGDVKKEKKAKKEKKVKDPNEPKRPATTYILFGQHARPIVQKDLGEKATKKEVEEEIRNRWTQMGDEERDSWKAAYEKNKQKYGVDIAAYKARSGLPNGTTPAPDDMDMADAAETAAGADLDAEGSDDDDDDSAPKKAEDSDVSSDDSDKEPSPPPKAPTPVPETKTPKSNKRRKTGESGAQSTPVPLPSASKVAAAAATPKVDSPKVERKKRGPKTKAEKAAEAERAEKEKAAEPEVAVPEKKTKRKR
ncbi:hypothetical protein K490DRAFT_61935 [Saccharata proteae CBS 121410]|uniref:HMG box domain-containing protein n=1 Tax=Saccharata proteae CBS 121410 TaxID=1314787 RepID=A0A9P4LYS4_9PEZI|nr:hypothetical protein K490DRAFT_61935 [Saccharata proteae CBS 121410]